MYEGLLNEVKHSPLFARLVLCLQPVRRDALVSAQLMRCKQEP